MAYNKETGMYEGYIYKIYNDINDKVYIGQTIRTIEIRWKEHCNSSVIYDYSLYKSMRKHDINKFHVKCIEKIENKNKIDLNAKLDEREIYWIAQYNSFKNGYNETIGGKDNAPNKFPERSVLEYDINGKLLNRYNSITDAGYSNNFSRSDIVSCCSRKKVNRVHNRIFRYEDDPLTEEEINVYKLLYPKIYQYDFDGNLLNIFEFIQDAVDYLHNICVSAINGNICACCDGKILSAAGFVWRKYPDEFNTYKTPELLKKIEKRDINTGELLEIFNSFTEIYDKYQYDISAINNCCNNYIASSAGFHWCYEGMFDKNNLNRINLKSVVQYSTSGECMAIFSSAAEAVYKLQLTGRSASAQILAVCNGKRNTAYGFIWRYIGEDFNKYEIKPQVIKCSINKYIDGKYIGNFKTSLDAAKSVGTTCRNSIIDCCKYKKEEYKGAKWYYSNDPEQPDKSKIT